MNIHRLWRGMAVAAAAAVLVGCLSAGGGMTQPSGGSGSAGGSSGGGSSGGGSSGGGSGGGAGGGAGGGSSGGGSGMPGGGGGIPGDGGGAGGSGDETGGSGSSDSQFPNKTQSGAGADAPIPIPGDSSSGSPGGSTTGKAGGSAGETPCVEGEKREDGTKVDCAKKGKDGGTGQSSEQGQSAAGGVPQQGQGAGGSGGSTATGEPPQGGAAGEGPSAPAAGGASRSEEIGKRLDETFGTFDEAVRTAQAQIAKEREAAQGAGGADEGAGSEEEGEAGGQGGAGGEGPKSPGGLESTNKQAQNREGAPGGEPGEVIGQGGVGGGASGAAGQTNVIPSDIPDGRDDDIVARQIREAAMKETDPELREALWEEYRRYKKGG
jgi:hypothetical protein